MYFGCVINDVDWLNIDKHYRAVAFKFHTNPLSHVIHAQTVVVFSACATREVGRINKPTTPLKSRI